MVINTLLTHCLLALSVVGSLAAPPLPPAETELAPLRIPKQANRLLKDQYIVVLKQDQPGKVEIKDQAIRRGIKHIYSIENNFKGYAGKFDKEALEKIRSDPLVKYVEHDAQVTTQDVQSGAPWGLARISHREPLTGGTNDKYIHDPSGGTGITAYVIDTGIDIQHPEFEGRAKWGATFASDGDVDGNGHGTHVAGTIGSKTYGVAKKANLVAVKVLNAQGSGTYSDVIAGINWAANDAKNNGANKSVANMSLGGGASDSVDEAVNSAVDSGLHMAVAAGNSNDDACKYSPARASKAIGVAASDSRDQKASFSNHGKCVHIIAPGVQVLSTWTNGGTKSISGTSMASPHIAGLIAYFLSIEPRDPAAMKEFLRSVAVKDAIRGFNTVTPNYLGFNNNQGSLRRMA
ncbi:uncharacterized protein VTP21DRAFT_7049 [Calcarisporiella thermophila]|uniref:uncharacterized protein n=1 Tax=Calcarisporiella thermophila TaxID=911321 RepID=UPI00374244E6